LTPVRGRPCAVTVTADCVSHFSLHSFKIDGIHGAAGRKELSWTIPLIGPDVAF
jgi:hypothetical protein